jgi:hypothetical protein
MKGSSQRGAKQLGKDGQFSQDRWKRYTASHEASKLGKEKRHNIMIPSE